jgi:hypothetical protein
MGHVLALDQGRNDVDPVGALVVGGLDADDPLAEVVAVAGVDAVVGAADARLVAVDVARGMAELAAGVEACPVIGKACARKDGDENGEEMASRVWPFPARSRLTS